jgi:uncharacterized protein YndB with AHSA1/START domain
MTIENQERRLIALEFEVPGTPEEVWQAIATGPGISSWLFPSEVEERQGGAVAFHIGPGMDSSGTVTAWQPPHRFSYEESNWSPGAPPLGTEFIIETRGGGTCVVRLVHSLDTNSDTWDNEFSGFEAGWASFFDVLRIYLEHFRGQRCSTVRLMTESQASELETWTTLTGGLGVAEATPGQRVNKAAASTVPPFSGVVGRVGSAKHAYELLIRLDQPAPGVALVGAYSWGGGVHAAIGMYLYGDTAASALERDAPQWEAWLRERFGSTVTR